VKLEKSIHSIKGLYFGLKGPRALRKSDVHYGSQPKFADTKKPSRLNPTKWYQCNPNDPFIALTANSWATFTKELRTESDEGGRHIATTEDKMNDQPTISTKSQHTFSDGFYHKLLDTLLLVQYLNDEKVAALYLTVRRRVHKVIARFAWLCFYEERKEWKLAEKYRNTWIDGFDEWERKHLEWVEKNILDALEYGLKNFGCAPEVFEGIKDRGPLRLLKEPSGTGDDNLQLTAEGHWVRVGIRDKDEDTQDGARECSNQTSERQARS